jgi:hypothetical protein
MDVAQLDTIRRALTPCTSLDEVVDRVMSCLQGSWTLAQYDDPIEYRDDGVTLALQQETHEGVTLVDLDIRRTPAWRCDVTRIHSLSM